MWQSLENIFINQIANSLEYVVDLQSLVNNLLFTATLSSEVEGHGESRNDLETHFNPKEWQGRWS